jgi:hypothetical protein
MGTDGSSLASRFSQFAHIFKKVNRRWSLRHNSFRCRQQLADQLKAFFS